ncbi:MAG: PAS domain S-box protein [Methanobacteriaceae archaeon]|nr:PAS domain S-box protein [Methanobacteriaceae archaeon]
MQYANFNYNDFDVAGKIIAALTCPDANFNYNDFDGVTKDIDLFNKSYLKTFPIMDILGFKKILDEVYVTGKTRNLKILYYVEDSLIASSRQKIFKYNNKIYCIFKTKSNSKTKFMDENDVRLLYNAPDPLMIIQNKKIVAANKANEKITGYKPEELLGNDYFFNNPRFKNKSSPYEFDEVYSKLLNMELFNYTDVLTIKHKDGSTVYAKATMQPSSFNGGPAVLFYAFDITEGVNHQIKAEKLLSTLDLVSNISKIAYVYWDYKNGYEWSDEFFNIIGEKKENLDLTNDIIRSFIVKDDRERTSKIIFDSIINSNSVLFKTQIQTSHGDIKDVEIYIDCQSDDEGQLINSVGYIQDISENIKETQQLTNLLQEKEVLLKEVHHCVKNNLQIILSLLNLNMRYKPDSPQETLESTKNRINTMAIVHKKLYQSEDYAHINLKDYIEEQARFLLANNDNLDIDLDLNLDNIKVSMDNAIPLSLIISEILNNSLNYAFPNNQSGIINISLKTNGDIIKLIIGDNGIGLPEDVDFDDPKDFGFLIMKSLIKQIEGSIFLLPSEGTSYLIEFNI